ncbi:MAG TPA: phosphoribosylamine--glycine ligase [Vicinamibacterales bacterium]|nr:phosphoribosylamine--glycine ligase [Vicinamibacterales bacterium]
MKILVVGGGAREHALCWRLSRDPGVDRVVCAPGNAGIARECTTVAVDPADPEALLALAEQQQIDLTVVGPEAALARGIADLFSARGRPIFGPRRLAAQLETSKAFAKDFMARHRVPTARYRVCSDADQALTAIRAGEFGDTLVVKADGLAGGKGVVVAETREDAEAAIRTVMVERHYGDAGSTVVLEERLSGPEVSFFVIADGEFAVPLVAAQDHKRIFDGDRGPNTGGMGAFAPSRLVDEAMRDCILAEIVRPVLHGLIIEGSPYRGVLYCGLMLTADGPKVIEFNVRFGDPEAQVVLPMVTEPLTPILWAAATGVLRSARVAFSDEPHVGVVLAAAGYPGEVRTGDVITGLDRVAADYPDVRVFHAGVTAQGDGLVTSGGRVMTVVAKGTTHHAAIARAYAAAGLIHFDGMQYRRDIAASALPL